MGRPISIVNFERSFWASMLLGIGGMVLHWTTVVDRLKTDPTLSGSVDVAVVAVGLALAFGFTLSLLLWYLISRRANNVAKWIYVVVTGFGVVSTLTSINDPLSPSGFALAISLVSTALTAASIFFLFRPDARAWFAREIVDPKTFD